MSFTWHIYALILTVQLLYPFCFRTQNPIYAHFDYDRRIKPSRNSRPPASVRMKLVNKPCGAKLDP